MLGNVCLRFIPVLDVVVHRFLEFGAGAMPTLDGILEHVKVLYRFHDHPVMYVYTTLYYFEKNLADSPQIRKKLVSVIIGSLQDIKPLHRCEGQSVGLCIQCVFIWSFVLRYVYTSILGWSHKLSICHRGIEQGENLLVTTVLQLIGSCDSHVT